MKLKHREWQFVAFIYDNIKKVGTFHINSIFGYKENGTDVPVSSEQRIILKKFCFRIYIYRNAR